MDYFLMEFLYKYLGSRWIDSLSVYPLWIMQGIFFLILVDFVELLT